MIDDERSELHEIRSDVEGMREDMRLAFRIFVMAGLVIISMVIGWVWWAATADSRIKDNEHDLRKLDTLQEQMAGVRGDMIGMQRDFNSLAQTTQRIDQTVDSIWSDMRQRQPNPTPPRP